MEGRFRFYLVHHVYFSNGALALVVFVICNVDAKICRRSGGDRIYWVFDNQLPAALRKLPFDRYLSLQNVKRVVSEADGYQPHLIAPEQGYRRLIESGLNYFRGPAEASVDAVRILFLCPKKRCSCGFLVCYVSCTNFLLLSLQVHNVLKELVRKSIGETEVGYLALTLHISTYTFLSQDM